MSGPKNRKRGIRYRFVTSMLTGVLLTLLLAWYGSRHHDSLPLSGAFVAVVVFGLGIFVAWSIVSGVRRAGERARERERSAARPAGGRGRRYGYGR